VNFTTYCSENRAVNGTHHLVQTIYKRLIGNQTWEPIKQVLFRELMYFLESWWIFYVTDFQGLLQIFLLRFHSIFKQFFGLLEATL